MCKAVRISRIDSYGHGCLALKQHGLAYDRRCGIPIHRFVTTENMAEMKHYKALMANNWKLICSGKFQLCMHECRAPRKVMHHMQIGTCMIQ
jgi:hypothetical protein